MTAERALHDALSAYLQSVFARLRHEHVAFPPNRLRGSGWVSDGADGFVLLDPADWTIGLWRADEAAKQGREYDHALAALRSHPVIGPRVDPNTSEPWHVDAKSVPGMLLERMVVGGDVLSFDQARFEREFRALYTWLTRDEDDVIVIAPLSGLAGDDLPIRLGPEIEIDRMTDKEVIACLTTRAVSGIGSATRVHVDPRLAVRIRERHPLKEGFWARDPLLGRIEPIEAVVHALRLLKPDKVSVPGMVDMPEAPYQGAIRWTPISNLPHRPFKTYVLESGDVERLTALWTALRDERITDRKPQQPLRIAIRRSGFAGERSRPDDQILDLMIAAEALFLAGEKTENRDKLSLRAGLFLADRDRPAREVAKFFRKAYDIRSTLAHGGEVDEAKLRMPDGAPGSVERYAANLGSYVRDALRRMIEMVMAEEPLPVHDWDEFTFRKLAP